MRLYDHLFTEGESRATCREGQDFTANLNPNSLEVIDGREAGAVAGEGARRASRYQFERLGYFCVDPDSTPGKLVFNRTVALRDTWAKIEKREKTS